MISQNPISAGTAGPATWVSSKPVTLPVVAQAQTPVAEPTEKFVPSQTPAPVAEKPVLKEPHGEMAEMLENIQRAQERDREQTINSSNLSGIKAQASPNGNSNVPTSLVMLEEPHHEETHEAEHHHPKPHHAWMGAHLGLDAGEHLFHAAAHGMVEAHAHAMSEASANALGEATDAGVSAAPHALSGILTALGSAGAALSGGLGVAMLYIGGKEIKAGLKKKDAEHTLEGVGSSIVGVRSGLAGASMLSALAPASEVAQVVAHGAHFLLPPLGIAHGAIDVGLGAKDIVVGIKKGDRSQIAKGALGVGLGGALAAVALGGGLPALGIAAVFLGGKIVHHIRSEKAGHEGHEEHAEVKPEAQEKASIPSASTHS